MKKQSKNKIIVIFENHPVRRIWDEKQEKWYFSIVDIVGVLSQSANPRNYWKVLKNRLNKEGGELVTKCNQLKMEASDGKYYLTDVGDVEMIFRLIQSIPSPKAEPFKLWLAHVGYERMQEMNDPDGNGDFSRKLGTLVKKNNLGFRERSWRYSMYIENGTIKNFYGKKYRKQHRYRSV